MYNIVQAEFFLANMNVGSIEDFMSELKERVEDLSPIKVCFRFHDEDGSMLALAEESKRLETRSRWILKKILVSKGVWRWWLDRQSRKVAGQSIHLRERALSAAIRHVERVVRLGGSLAVEGRGHLYRWPRPDEVHELLEAARRATGVWLFITPDEHLLSNKNTRLLSWLM